MTEILVFAIWVAGIFPMGFIVYRKIPAPSLETPTATRLFLTYAWPITLIFLIIFGGVELGRHILVVWPDRLFRGPKK